MKTSLIVLLKNEVEYVAITMSTVYTYFLEQKMDFELIAVDDSSDGTWEFLQSFAASHKNVIAVKGGEPSGYGRALRKGITAASGDIVIPFNGDLSDSLTDMSQYIKLIEGGYDMVFGSRFMAGAKTTDSPTIKESISRLSNKFLQIIFDTDCNDLTNSFKAYRSFVLREIDPKVNGYHIGMEIALKAILKKYEYTTIPVTWNSRKYGQSKMSILRVIPKYLFTALEIKWNHSRFRYSEK